MINIQQDKFDTSWIESLAIEELNMEESGFIQFTESTPLNQILEESSLSFMNKVKDRFEFYTSLFNQYRLQHGQSSAIKIFRISNTVNDFMLFRNSMKLIVARKAADVISVGFLSNSGGLFSPRIPGDQTPGTSTLHELKAHVGPFNSITWRYQGEVVEVEALVKFYFSEFVRQSCR